MVGVRLTAFLIQHITFAFFSHFPPFFPAVSSPNINCSYAFVQLTQTEREKSFFLHAIWLLKNELGARKEASYLRPFSSPFPSSPSAAQTS